MNQTYPINRTKRRWSRTYASGLRMVSQNQLFPKSGTVIVRTRATLARLMQVQNVSSAAWPRLGTISPSNLLERIIFKVSADYQIWKISIWRILNCCLKKWSSPLPYQQLNTKLKWNLEDLLDCLKVNKLITSKNKGLRVAYVMVSPLSNTEKLLRVKNDRISPATRLGALSPSPSTINVFFTTCSINPIHIFSTLIIQFNSNNK